MIENLAASIKARLLNIAREEQINFNQILLLYFHERLLYRLSVSKYNSNFFLKGGILVLSTTDFKTRPTKDIDFLAQNVSNDPEYFETVFQDLCQIDCNDGVEFDPESITVEKITEGAQYEGLRVNILSFLGNARQKLQLDIGFGDVIIPEPQELDYPVLLDSERPKINSYSLESVIAEKFESMLNLAFINSRMKDFYDIYTLSTSKSFDGRVLQEAIFETTQKRGTILKEELEIFTTEFIEKKEQMWKTYLRKIGKQQLEFSEVIKKLEDFLAPIYSAIIKEDEFLKKWNNEKGQWEHFKV